MATTTKSRVLTVEKAAIRFAEPFRITGYVFEAMPSIIAQIVDGDSLGRGEAAGVYYLGDGQDQMLEMIETVRGAIEAGLTRDDLQEALPPCGARNALDCALWELDSRAQQIAVWKLAGVPRPRPLITTFTLPADDPSVLALKVRRLDFAKAIKLKLDGDIETDRERIKVVRDARPDAWLAVDANQGFVAADLDSLGSAARDHSVSLIEQPLKRGEDELLEGWRPGIPIAADESILDLSELQDKARPNWEPRQPGPCFRAWGRKLRSLARQRRHAELCAAAMLAVRRCNSACCNSKTPECNLRSGSPPDSVFHSPSSRS